MTAIAEVEFGRISENRGDLVDIIITEYAPDDEQGQRRTETITIMDWDQLSGSSHAEKLESYTGWANCEYCDKTTIASSNL